MVLIPAYCHCFHSKTSFFSRSFQDYNNICLIHFFQVYVQIYNCVAYDIETTQISTNPTHKTAYLKNCIGFRHICNITFFLAYLQYYLEFWHICNIILMFCIFARLGLILIYSTDYSHTKASSYLIGRAFQIMQTFVG